MFNVRILLSLIILASPAQAHVPILETKPKTIENPYLIVDAEHSKAIFAVLDGDADYYKIEEVKPFNFYVGITAAKLEGCDLQKTFSYEVLDANMKVKDRRDGNAFDWWPWYEKFGKKWYWIGPEIGQDFASAIVYPAGTYFIRIFNDENQGKYVLAIGDVEHFGLKTILTLRSTMRQIETIFWDERGCP